MKKGKKKLLFDKRNYQLMILGLVFITLGFFLMSGGGSDDPNIFSEEIYNFRRIRLAPFLVVFGFVIEVYAIMKNPN
tara:strand:+ start:21922 stop:22152 length:231 start_codon:yes stop_codon:yes gene_type:complete